MRTSKVKREKYAIRLSSSTLLFLVYRFSLFLSLSLSLFLDSVLFRLAFLVSTRIIDDSTRSLISNVRLEPYEQTVVKSVHD